MPCMAVVSVRVSDELKRRMEKLRHVNWSEVLRQAIVRILEEEGRNLALAVLLNEKIRKKAPEEWDSTEFLRRWRDGRYG